MSTITFGQAPQLVRAPRVASAPSAPSAAVRLTRRGKIAVLTLAIVAIGILAVVLGPSSTATDQVGTPEQTTTVAVMPGHTLWQIAAAANPDGDIRATVDDIIELNSLPSASALQMGSEIAVPVYDK
ncbi:LysM peptidoglycan-binding domain-containing protein [Aeromicrobium sp. CFBP 8757]|uniref:LysM peptidoglycan-binding domain-containing protein n=1 Tax=Aeromicrobium sp. CFBP 8757 TaxID=2775288 RepID=UPI0017837D5C|nr:LysM domain-containing protein [Aeromicrobium sp. CFBP 8757]MBD8606004.1 LysM peptidoglycan-binding domain-containing protein [Aeromicrobium sp. CFBP 8757]